MPVTAPYLCRHTYWGFFSWNTWCDAAEALVAMTTIWTAPDYPLNLPVRFLGWMSQAIIPNVLWQNAWQKGQRYQGGQDGGYSTNSFHCIIFTTFHITNTLVNFWISHSYLIGVTAIGHLNSGKYLIYWMILVNCIALHNIIISEPLSVILYIAFIPDKIFIVTKILLATDTTCWCLNSLRLRQNGYYFADEILNSIFLNENV